MNNYLVHLHDCIIICGIFYVDLIFRNFYPIVCVFIFNTLGGRGWSGNHQSLSFPTNGDPHHLVI